LIISSPKFISVLPFDATTVARWRRRVDWRVAVSVENDAVFLELA
jgi:hypothetical protein